MSTDPSPPDDQPPKRAYDARSRQQRAARERLDNQDRVLSAARTCFLDDGFAATKMVDIANEAGVALASLYRAAPGKVDLVLMLMGDLGVPYDSLDQADAGTDTGDPASAENTDDPPFAFPWIAAETDPHVQVRLIAEHIGEIMELIGPMWPVCRDAAAVDARVTEAMYQSSRRRVAAFEVAVDLLPSGALRTDHADATDTLYALSGPELYLEMTTVRGWSHDHYVQWLSSTLKAVLLKPQERN